MKNLLFLSYVLIVCLFCTACNRIDTPDQINEDTNPAKEETNLAKVAIQSENQNEMDDRVEQVLSIIKNCIVDFGEFQRITIHIVNDQYSVAELLAKDYPYYETLGNDCGVFYLVDLHDNSVNILPIEAPRFVKIKGIENTLLTFYIEGHSETYFGFFPYLLLYDTETKKHEIKPYFADFTEKFMLGGGHTLGIRQIELVNESIVFHFSENDNTVLAGGLFAPTIEIPYRFPIPGSTPEEREIIFSLCFYGTSLLVDLEEQLKELEKLSLIENAYVEKFNDCFGENYVVVFFKFAKRASYNCGFNQGENNICDFYLTFK